jgi:hypothetical protein
VKKSQSALWKSSTEKLKAYLHDIMRRSRPYKCPPVNPAVRRAKPQRTMTTKKTTTSKRQRSWLVLLLSEAGKKAQMRRTKVTVKKKTKMMTMTRKTTMRTTESGTVAPPLQCLNPTISKQAVKTIPIKAPESLGAPAEVTNPARYPTVLWD